MFKIYICLPSSLPVSASLVTLVLTTVLTRTRLE